MNELIEEINKHKDNNLSIIEELINKIEAFKINSKEELLKFENDTFTTDNIDKRIDKVLNYYYKNTSIFDIYESYEIEKLEEYEKLLNESNNINEKIKYLLLLCDYSKMDLFFPYQAYELIINNDLKGKYDDYFYNLNEE